MHEEAKSNAAGHRPVPPSRARAAAALAWLALIGPMLGACSMSFPMNSMLPEDVTGSLAKVPFGALLDEEDRRREKAALATALDPQGDGAKVHWENPRSGRKGALAAVGNAYPMDSRVCRGFSGELRDGDAMRAAQGIACTVAAGEWEVHEIKPLKRA